MSSISFRKNTIPPKVMLLRDDITLPSGYTSDTNHIGKYLKNVPNGATNPGTNIGASTHQHPSAAHSHGIGTTTHLHRITHSAGESSIPVQPGIFSTNVYSTAGHVHPYDTANDSPGGSTSSTGHQHNSENNDPLFKTYKLIKKNSIIGLRRNTAPFKSMILWNQSTFLDVFSQDSGIFNNLIKVDSTPNQIGGRSTHQHAAGGNSHTGSINSHNHTGTGTTMPTSPNTTILNAGGNTSVAISSHGHSITPTIGSNTDSITTDTDSHQHPSDNFMPASKEVYVLKLNRISLRRTGIPIKGIVFWEDLLASIPAGLALTDGTGGTDNFLDKYAKGTPDGPTAPGTETGSNTHTHGSVGDHQHNYPMTHTHTANGGSGASTNNASLNNGGSVRSSSTHTHNLLGTNPTSSNGTSALGGTHSESSTDNKPASREIAFIQRI